MKYLMKIQLILMMIFLSGCGMYVVHTNSSAVKPYLNKELRFTRPMLLIQSSSPGIFHQKNYVLIAAPKITSSHPGLYFDMDHKIPSVEDFYSERRRWQTWQGHPLFKQIRIVGIISPGILFHLSSVTTAPYAPYTVEVTIDSGAYQGISGLYVPPQELIPLNILKEE